LSVTGEGLPVAFSTVSAIKDQTDGI
jgi:hypothetical protein